MAKSNSEYKSIQKKLVAAVAMVLVASVMVVSSSYAWFTLSTAPEVTGITTSVGSNGNLEMALRTVQDLNSITTATGESFPKANNYWGNLVNLSDPSYHLDSIALAPARLNIVLDTQNSKYVENTYTETSDKKDAYKEGDTYKSGVITEVTMTGDAAPYTYTIKAYELYQPAYKLNGAAGSAPYLQTPIYGTDGRLSALSSDSVINGTYTPDANGFAESVTGSWGVRAIGTTSSISPAEMALRTAKRAVSSAITSAQSDASTSLRVDAVKLANILINTTLKDGYAVTEADQTAINTAITNLKNIAASLENAMKQTVIAVGVAQNVTPALTAQEIKFENGSITARGIDWAYASHIQADLIKASAVLNGMTSDLESATTKVSGNDFKGAMNVMLSSDDFKITDSRNGTKYDVQAIKNMAETAPVTAAGILMNTPIISIEGGIYADIAAFAGNYSANASIQVDVTYGSISLNGEKLDVTMATNVAEKTYTYKGYSMKEGVWTEDTQATTVSGYYLPLVLTHLNTVNSSAGDQNSMQIITDIYGYAIDLAFRTNAAGSNLLLQTEAANRVEDSEFTQGGGSYMQFTKGNEQFTWEQLVNLIQSVRVVFISDAGSIYGVAAMQGLKYEPAYAKNEAGLYVDAQGTALDDQNNVSLRVHADYVAGTAGHDLKDENGKAITLTGCKVVTVDGKTYIKAPLKLYGYSVNDKGVLSLGSELASGSLTALQQNVATALTSLVYLDGDTVENSDVAISGSSMTGTMNLQFASDATLDPMDYTFTQSQLSAPTASITEKTLTINNVEHATKYKIYFVEGSIKTPIHTVNAAEGTTTVLDLSALNGIGTPGATYNLEIVASGENYTDSTGYAIQYTVPNT